MSVAKWYDAFWRATRGKDLERWNELPEYMRKDFELQSGILEHRVITLSEARMKNMHDTPLEVIPGKPGTIIHAVRTIVFVPILTAARSSGGGFRFALKANTGATPVWLYTTNSIAAGSLRGSTVTAQILYIAHGQASATGADVTYDSIIGAPLHLVQESTNAFGSGNDANAGVTLSTWFRYLKLS